MRRGPKTIFNAVQHIVGLLIKSILLPQDHRTGRRERKRERKRKRKREIENSEIERESEREKKEKKRKENKRPSPLTYLPWRHVE